MENLNYKNKNIEIKYLNNWYNSLISCLPQSRAKIAGFFKDKVASFFKPNTTKYFGKKSWKEKKLRKKKTQKQYEENIIRDIKTLFEQEDDYYELIRGDDFWKIIILNMNVTMIEILTYH